MAHQGNRSCWAICQFLGKIPVAPSGSKFITRNNLLGLEVPGRYHGLGCLPGADKGTNEYSLDTGAPGRQRRGKPQRVISTCFGQRPIVVVRDAIRAGFDGLGMTNEVNVQGATSQGEDSVKPNPMYPATDCVPSRILDIWFTFHVPT